MSSRMVCPLFNFNGRRLYLPFFKKSGSKQSAWIGPLYENAARWSLTNCSKEMAGGRAAGEQYP